MVLISLVSVFVVSQYDPNFFSILMKILFKVPFAHPPPLISPLGHT